MIAKKNEPLPSTAAVLLACTGQSEGGIAGKVLDNETKEQLFFRDTDMHRCAAVYDQLRSDERTPPPLSATFAKIHSWYDVYAEYAGEGLFAKAPFYSCLPHPLLSENETLEEGGRTRGGSPRQ